MGITLSGAPGTGKTTLKTLIGKYTTLKKFRETEERVAEKIMGFKSVSELIKTKGIPGAINNFFISMIEKEREDRTNKPYIADKSIYDMGARWFGRLWTGTFP